jgi:hypothetical protein
MTTLTTHVEIKASKEKVFEVLCDLENYTKWHPSIQKIYGDMEQGAWITAYFGSKKRSIKIPVEVSVLTKNENLEWQGSLFKKGIFRKYFLVRHAFYVEDIGNGLTRFTNEEEFPPVISGLVKRREASFIAGYNKVNNALKSYCE